ncbi:MAG: LPXTG cell wall anchor domain-containing protein [Acidimicrobiales bacterium]
MDTKHVGKAWRLLFGTGLAVSTLGAGIVAATVTLPTPAFADTPCTPTAYVGCVPPSQGTGGGASTLNATEPTTSATPDAGLPFTGADIEQLAAIGGGAVLAGGGLLVFRRRRRSRTLA